MRHKRISSFALAAAIAVTSVAVGPLPAMAAASATNYDINLSYIDNLDIAGSKGSAYVLTGNPIGIQMDLGDFSIATETETRNAFELKNTESGDGSSGSTVPAMNVTRKGNKFTVSIPNLDDGVRQQQFSIEANVNSLTPPARGYSGRVSSGGLEGSANLLTGSAITQTGTISIKAKESETPRNPNVSFELAGTTGFFGSMGNTTPVSVVTGESDVGKGANVSNKTITVRIGNDIKVSFVQPLRYSEIKDGDKYLTADGELCADQDNPDRVPNNYIRKDAVYTLTFNPPKSSLLYLTVATPQHVGGLVAADIKSDGGKPNNKREYIKLKGNDTLELIAEDTFTLVTKDDRYNATFDIKWTWAPDETQATGVDANAAKKAVMIPNSTNARSVTAAVARQENDVSGVLTAEVYYKGEELITGDSAPKFNLVIRGEGIPATVTRSEKTTGSSADPVKVTFGQNATENADKSTALPKEIVMDAFQGGISSYAVAPKGPYQYVLDLNMGQKNAKSLYAEVSLETTEGKDVLELRQRKGSDILITDGRIENPNAAEGFDEEGVAKLVLNARSAGKATVKVDFHVNINGKDTIDSTHSVQVVVNDSTPSQDATLKELVIQDAKKEDKTTYGFGSPPPDPKSDVYKTPIALPYSYTQYKLFPTVNNAFAAQKPVTVSAYDSNGTTASILGEGQTLSSSATVSSGSKEGIVFTLSDVNKIYRIDVKVDAQDPRYSLTYSFYVYRIPPSTDDTLESLGIYLQEDTGQKNNLIQNFDPSNRGPYRIEIPYSAKYLQVIAKENFPKAVVTYAPELKNLEFWGKKIYLDVKACTEEEVPGSGGLKLPRFQVKVRPESEGSLGQSTGVYDVFLERMPASKESRLQSLEIIDAADRSDKPRSLSYTPSFNRDNTGPYRLTIPYSVEQIRFKLTPVDGKVAAIRILDADDNRKVLDTIENPMSYSDAISINVRDPQAQVACHKLIIQVVAESGSGKDEPAQDEVTEYQIEVEREEASDDSLLKNLVLQDQDGAQIKTFAFHPNETSYTLSVPYETSGISFTPTANHTGAKINIQEEGVLGSLLPENVGSGMTSKTYKLDSSGKPKEFQVIVTAEDGKAQTTYRITVTRAQPSSDSRLKGLTASNLDGELEPRFIASRTKYTATLKEGANGTVITATANHPGATIRINGNVTASGQPSDLIELIEVKQDVRIEVTAQDGMSKTVYTIAFTNDNLVEKTSNADLRRLSVNYGMMTPNFKPSITDYEVAVTEDTWSVDIIPKTDDPLATMRVFAGSKEIGDYDGNYSQALEDGENDISIEVTSPDKTKTKTYTVTVYRNEEDGMKYLTPLEAEDVDFESDDVILVMIDEYPRVSASVFEELKNYPEKTIIFQGNDYSLEFKASELNRVIPQREIYDFRMSFTSPDEDDIYDLMSKRSRNDDIIDRAVMIYFDYHGSLPGPATFHLSLGKKYASDTLYWHYYNMERERIDYYGSLKSNSKGNIAVTLDHFSTYILTPKHRIAGSENKEGVIDELGSVSDGSDKLTTGDKTHPFTGALEGMR